jgi:hypothetical protein
MVKLVLENLRGLLQEPAAGQAFRLISVGRTALTSR